jgi:hypothetical protein
MAHEQGVTIGWAFGDLVGTYAAARTGHILDDKTLAQRLAQLVANGACQDVAAAPGVNGTTIRTGLCGYNS